MYLLLVGFDNQTLIESILVNEGEMHLFIVRDI
jgi:hypothetical protein